MSKYCRYCGSALSVNARFCTGCGAGVKGAQQVQVSRQKPQAALPVCSRCGADLRSNAVFCRFCGTPRAPRQDNVQDNKLPKSKDIQNTAKASTSTASVKQSVREAEKLLGGEMASAQGDMIFDYTSPLVLDGLKDAAASVTKAIGPFKMLLGGFLQLIQGFKGAFKDKKKLIPALIFAVVWILLTLLPALGIVLPGGRFLSWLTFAQGGMQGGVPGFLGGVFGKGLFVSVLMGLFTPKSRPKKPADLIKQKVSPPFGLGGIGLVMAGAGVALFGYNLMTGDNSLQNSMIGLVAAVGSLRSMLSRSGYLRRLLTAFGQKFSKGWGVSPASLNRFTAGMAAGFSAALLLSVPGVPWLGYALGGLLFIAGGVVSLTARPTQTKGVTA